MTTQDRIFKWFLYALGLVPVWVLETMILNRVPFPIAHPLLLPAAAVTVAVLEGAWAGCGFGMAVGIIADAVYPGLPGGMTVGLALAGCASGILAQYGVRQSYLGSLLCTAATMILMDFIRVAAALFTGSASLGAMVPVALAEIGWSLLFTPVVYLIFKPIRNKVKRLGD